MHLKCMFVTFLISLCAISAMMNNGSPPYDLIFDRFEIHNNTETFVKDIQVRVKKFNRTTYVLDGQFTFIKEFNDDYTALLVASSLSGNEYKVITTKLVDKPCSFLIDNQVIYPELVEVSNLPKNEPGMCPFKPDTFVIKNYFIKDSKLPAQLPSGDKWKFDIIFSDKEQKQILAAVSYYLIVERKTNGQGG